MVVPSLAHVCKPQTYLFKWSPLQFNINRNKLPGDSLKSNCSGKVVTQVASATDREPFPDSCWVMKEPGNDVPRGRIRTRGVIELLFVRTENKDPSNLFTTFIPFNFLS